MTHPPRRWSAPHRLALVIGSAFLLGACVAESPSPSPSPPASVAESAAPSLTSSVEPSVPATPPPALVSGPVSVSLQAVTEGLDRPLGVENAGDGSERLFVVEQNGHIHAVSASGQMDPDPFLDISSLVLSGGERGLLGLAFHPEYERNGRFFVAYTSRPSGANTVAEYRVSSDAGRADPGTGRILFAVPDPAANHNGGSLAFGPDGYLYIAMGDGGGQNDQFGNGQNVTSLLGKILRVDVDAAPAAGRAYAIPSTNPFVGGGGAPEIWAYGVRNPWRITFDRALGALFMGDVGGGAWEEINRQDAGASGGVNYGWPLMEGPQCRSASCPAGLVAPIAAYDHGSGCSVIGGYIYRGTAQPQLQGAYFFGDWCSGRLFSLDVAGATITVKTVLATTLAVSSFGEDEAGEIYVVDIEGGGLYRVVGP